VNRYAKNNFLQMKFNVWILTYLLSINVINVALNLKKDAQYILMDSALNAKKVGS